MGTLLVHSHSPNTPMSVSHLRQAGKVYNGIYWHKPNSCKSEHDLEHNFWHEGEHKKARSRARFLARGKAPKRSKKHDLWHEGEHQKAQSRARFLARGRAPKSTILCTRESAKKHDLEHDFLHEGKPRKARLILRTKENTQNNVRPTYQEIIEILFLTVTAIRTDSRYIVLSVAYIFWETQAVIKLARGLHPNWGTTNLCQTMIQKALFAFWIVKYSLPEDRCFQIVCHCAAKI